MKDGCAEGVCGSCSVLVDGKAVRACKLTVAKVHGKPVTTIEGLSAREREVYAWAFGEVGAVQCGFCMPGMVISAKSLLDAESRAYRWQMQSRRFATTSAAAPATPRSSGRFSWPRRHCATARLTTWRVGTAQRGRRARCAWMLTEKLLGTGEFVDDMQVPGMLHGAVLRAKYPRALVKKIDISAAQAAPGVEAVLTAKDVPGERLLGHIVHDWPVMIAEGEETRYVGDALAMLAATTKDAAREGARV